MKREFQSAKTGTIRERLTVGEHEGSTSHVLTTVSSTAGGGAAEGAAGFR